MGLTLEGMTPVLGGGNYGGGDAALGAAGGAVVGSLLGNNGLFGNRGGDYGRYGGVTDPSIIALQQQIDTLASSLNTNGLRDAIGKVDSDMGSGFAAINGAITSSSLTNLTQLNDLGRDFTNQTNQNNIQQMNSFNRVGIDMVQGFNGIERQAQNVANQILAQGTAAAAKLAECCCEIKQAIAADGNQTRALINDNTIQALRDKNTDLSVKVSNNDQNQYLLNTILAHFKPTPTV